MNTHEAADRFAHLKPGDPWPEDGLERVERCPVCNGAERSLLYEGLQDRVFFCAPGEWTLYRCSGCGLAYLDPRPTRETMWIAYRSYFTHAHANRSQGPTGPLKRLKMGLRNGYLNAKFGYRHCPAHRWGYIAMHLLPPTLRLEWDYYARHLAPPVAGKNRLLDVGCGNGDFLARVAEAGWSATGVDFDPQAVQGAQSRGLDVIHGDAEHAGLTEESFDVVTLSHLIEHVHDPARLLSSCFRLLKPGGVLWLATPNLNALGHRRYARAWLPLDPPRHLTLFYHSALFVLLRQVGFTEPVKKRRGFHVSAIWTASEAIQKGEQPSFGSGASGQFTLLSALSEILDYFIPNVAEEIVLVARKSLSSSTQL